MMMMLKVWRLYPIVARLIPGEQTGRQTPNQRPNRSSCHHPGDRDEDPLLKFKDQKDKNGMYYMPFL